VYHVHHSSTRHTIAIKNKHVITSYHACEEKESYYVLSGPPLKTPSWVSGRARRF